jgi:hypothetical protein
MTVALATAWRPRGEMARFQRLLPTLQEVYPTISISLPPDAPRELSLSLHALPGLFIVQTEDWSWGRHLSLSSALESEMEHIHYTDFDRLLRWVETRPDEWRAVVEKLKQADCLIIGRTPEAYDTHPQALIRTEAISNSVTSFLVGKQMDVSAGSKGFSRSAVEYLLKASPPGRALGTDAEWPVLLHKAGYLIDYLEVEGLDWESADRYQNWAAGAEGQRKAALAYDADPKNWADRVEVAREIVELGIEAALRAAYGNNSK